MGSRNVFITGAKHTGKTTALKKYLDETGICYGGFVTQRALRNGNSEFSLHLLTDYQDTPSDENFLFMCGKAPRNADEINRRFDDLGTSLLRSSEGKGLIVMDELGPNEAGAKIFHREVVRCLDSGQDVLGILQDAEDPFLDSIKNRDDTVVLYLTEENRNDIPDMIRKIFCQRDDLYDTI